MEENLITIVDDNGNELLCEVLFTFESEDFNRSYVLYVPVESKDDDENVEVLCSAFIPNPDGSIGELLPIDKDEEWEMIEEVFNTEFPFDDDDHDHECCGGHHHDHDDDHECACDHDDDK
jgi:uncharacterized protein YrzB (UPF0473 family)